MATYLNTFETVKEAMMRLRRTVVVYDGEPYVVLCITNHKADGIFRIYLQATGLDPNKPHPPRPEPEGFPPEHSGIGGYMDTWMEQHPNVILRKRMNSPLFNKFRPYPLGMCNIKGSGTYYIERQPNRKTEQGLISSMLNETQITAAPQQAKRVGSVDVYGVAFKSCVMGDHPSAAECLANLTDPDILNDAAAFSREFALVRGPIGMLFLAYKHDVVGVLPNNDFSCVRLGREFHHTKEVVEKLDRFSSIIL